ncbi:MAG: RNA-binding transcriptional accessory protein [Chloroflexi bacterium]|nr:MAG: RNA-binding transcriptional accessory protein [Chloroflexota bacterium]
MGQALAGELQINPEGVVRTLALLDDGNTVPFIARYRKEATGNLDEVQILAISDRAQALRTLHTRKHDVLRIIGEQGKLTAELAGSIIESTTVQAVEDLYMPYRPKRKTRASVARERGLEPLADLIVGQDHAFASALDAAASFVNPELGVESAESALAGARDICAETIMEDARVRGDARRLFFRDGLLTAKLTVDPEQASDKDPKGVYRLYYDFMEPVARMVPHRTLALNRAEREDVVHVSVDVPFEQARPVIHSYFQPDLRSPLADELNLAISDGYKRLLAPALEREVRSELTRQAEEHAITIFTANLRNLLLQPPLRGARILGLDPGYRTGCKVAVVDENGAYIESTTIYPHAPSNRWKEAKDTLIALIARHNIRVLAIGNGTASRETEALAAEIIRDLEEAGKISVGYVMVNEAGASVYSASDAARREFPDLDSTQRGTISIARRLQDPLAELVKIDPAAVGVGLYQHDVDQRALADALDRVVTSCVNFAGVDLNVASAQLLRYVSGISSRVADHIVTYRREHGPFVSREQLKKVAGVGSATFVQAAGFLKVAQGVEPLDNTFIHPESYTVVRRLLQRLPTGNGSASAEKIADRVHTWRLAAQAAGRSNMNEGGLKGVIDTLAEELEVGVPTLADIIENLEKPGLDPRDALPAPILRHDVLSLSDLREGMVLQGTVRNVVDFGAFVDIGVKQDGLVHISELSDRYVKDPLSVVAVGQVVQVRVLSVDVGRGRVQLSMRGIL